MLKALLVVHGLAGVVALLALPIPLVARKGGRLHRRAGWVFVGGMWVVCATAWIVSAYRLWEGDPRRRIPALFLGYVGLLAFSAQWGGMRALRFKRRDARHRGLLDLAIPGLLVAGGVAMFAVALRAGSGAVVLQAFSVVGMVIGAGDLRYWLRAPDDRMHWWYQHMGGMLGAGIAAVTAFAVVNAASLGLTDMRITLAVWLAPGAIGTPAIFLWAGYYRRRFAREQSPAAGVPSANDTGGSTR